MAGASGSTGKKVVRELRERGFAVRAGVRVRTHHLEIPLVIFACHQQIHAPPCAKSWNAMRRRPDVQDVSKAKAGGVQLDDKVELVEADVTQGAEYVGPPFAPLACCCVGFGAETLCRRGLMTPSAACVLLVAAMNMLK